MFLYAVNAEKLDIKTLGSSLGPINALDRICSIRLRCTLELFRQRIMFR
jgi:hypothetical protein